MEIESKQQIFERGKGLERKLAYMLKETESAFSLQDIRDVISHEEDSDDIMKVVAIFDRSGDASKLRNILELVIEAWDYFPHQVLGSISHAEKALEDPKQ